MLQYKPIWAPWRRTAWTSTTRNRMIKFPMTTIQDWVSIISKLFLSSNLRNFALKIFSRFWTNLKIYFLFHFRDGLVHDSPLHHRVLFNLHGLLDRCNWVLEEVTRQHNLNRNSHARCLWVYIKTQESRHNPRETKKKKRVKLQAYWVPEPWHCGTESSTTRRRNKSERSITRSGPRYDENFSWLG